MLLTALLAGGSWNHPISALVVRLASLPAASIVAWRLATGAAPAGAALPLALVGTIFAVGLAQLIPLPPDLWLRLPGRASFLAVYAVIGEHPPWLPLSLTPAATLDSLMAFLPPAVMVSSVLFLDDTARRRLAAIIPPIAVLGVLLGIAQVLAGAGSPLRIYFREDADAVGLFSNRDFYASMLAAAIPFVVVTGAKGDDDAQSRLFWMLARGAAVLVLVAGLATSRSRAGVLLAVPAAAGAAAILLMQLRTRSEPSWARLAPALVTVGAGLGVALVLALAFGPIAARFQEPLSGDLRLQLGPNTAALAQRYAPVGSGLGSFEPVYETIETPDHMIGTYAGHAHNDFLEFGLEAGWAAVVLMALFLVWYARGTLQLVRDRGEPGADLGLVGALVIALLLAHSMVEFPLRTPALATLFAFACGLMVLPRGAPASFIGVSTTRRKIFDSAVARNACRLAIALVVVLAALAIIRQAFVTSALEGDEPETALTLAPTNPEVLAGAAARRAETAKSDADFRSAGQLARAALRRSPLEPAALRALSWEDDREGRKDEALATMTLAGRLTQRDNYIHGTLFWDAMARRDWQAAFLNVDPVLRRVRDLGPAFFPAMIQALSDPAARQAAVARLVWRPDWRGPFLTSLANDPNSRPSARLVFDALDATSAPLSQAEQTLLIESLVEAGDYSAAKDEWRRFLPASARRSSGLLYDGAFEALPGPPPFNWEFVDTGRVLSEIGTAPDGEPALHLQYDGGRAEPLLTQVLVLPPGVYRLSGTVLFDQTSAADQLTWRLDCVGGASLFEQRQRPMASGWGSFEIEFTTPATGCPAERLSLGSLAQDNVGDRQAWLRNLFLVAAPS